MIGILPGRAQKQIPIIWSRLRRRVASGPENNSMVVVRTKLNLKKYPLLRSNYERLTVRSMGFIP